MVLAVPVKQDQGGSEPGAMLNTPEMDAAKKAILTMMARMEQVGTNLKHAEAQIVLGADMLRCKFKVGKQEPTINVLQDRNGAQIDAVNLKMHQEVSADPQSAQAIQGHFMPMTFRNAVDLLAKKNPGCTVWDGGELPFSVDGAPYPLPTRLLVARRFGNTEGEVAATHYRVLSPTSEPSETPIGLLRSSEPQGALQEIVYVDFLVGIPMDVLWPAPGTYARKPAMTAAVIAFLEFLKKLNGEGRLHRCVAEIEMGADRLKFSFVGDKSEPAISLNGTAATMAYTDLSYFNVELEEQKQHELFKSESQFQAIKQMMQERARQDPERFTARAPMIALMAAQFFLDTNFPGCETSDEGEVPVTINGQAMALSNTRLTVSKAAGRSTNNIVAAIMSVPLPSQGGWTAATEERWLETKEMKAAEEALLAILKRWYSEGRIADDCMAQVMMGTDATIYRFVGGEKFEDYDDERMKQFTWG
jgi:hypothetical protein